MIVLQRILWYNFVYFFLIYVFSPNDGVFCSFVIMERIPISRPLINFILWTIPRMNSQVVDLPRTWIQGWATLGSRVGNAKDQGSINLNSKLQTMNPCPSAWNLPFSQHKIRSFQLPYFFSPSGPSYVTLQR